ncbi:hypothetical protein Ab1vBOLIVR2_gp71 [Agrobacterium phage OLIVR2]|uniref:Uncharacterized protein n=1 Tax=Agrobacterium phage OLIVR1 TaxID=2723769 RepID=A0A858MR63_9CAUD|nr:hypothetical protein [Xanthomonas campestris]YP_010107105.1 hypothetical protein KNU98_gp038 [Agrobacterium phage OLIVR1]QIW87374.1 hypothetical protein Ab1vBOLIVR2_gp71 [Agrobacterium phage OLIVR2]QIW87481.1 hypothetical protein Ab1vBOLIVR3_gp71 [Agrobacterium phage OLIVR3]MCF8861653.1 hypothetical protein [Xanthomonas campestris pv. campestris]QIW87266.1 hypothetical protein Ab1vBOLIVR1_gp71 [Agrobacterium phage OLIVR1]
MAVTTKAEYLHRKAIDENRVNFVNGIIKELMSSDKARLDTMIKEIIEEHEKLTQTDGFFFDGRVYTNKVGIPFKSLQKVGVHPSLKARVLEYKKQCRDIENDEARIGQGLAVLVRNATSPQHFRDAVPDILLPLVPSSFISTKNLKRTIEEGALLTTKLHRDQFQKTMDRIYFYLGSRLLG